MEDVTFLASDAMKGRLVGTPENAEARAFVIDEFETCGAAPLNETYIHEFTFTPRRFGEDAPEPEPVTGYNVVAKIEGTAGGDDAIVATAHFDHVGERDGEIHNGADDNASGTAALIAMACHFADNPPENDLVLAALDAEEGGLWGARKFVEEAVYPIENIALNVNMDMVSRDTEGRLWAVGTAQNPFLKEHIDEAAEGLAALSINYGFDDPSLPRGQSWVMASDHAAFYMAGLPFIYFGVEDHEDYHQPSDTAEKIDPAFYADTATLIGRFIQNADANLAAISQAHADHQAALEAQEAAEAEGGGESETESDAADEPAE